MVVQVHEASIDEEMGNVETALELLRRSMALSGAMNDRRWQAIILNNTAHAEARTGNNRQALKLYAEALTARRELGNPSD